jgi:peptidoglycan/LPS O-acetylase OafA/YrhL
MKKQDYYPYLDRLRALCAIYVVLQHIVLQFQFLDFYDMPFLKRLSITFVSFGHLAVNFFIVLSGFCLSIPLIKQNEFKLSGGILKFYKKRVRRIVIPYYFALAFSLVLIWTLIGSKTGTHWDISIPVDYVDIIAHFLLVHDIFIRTGAAINHAFWSISVECRIYILFPFILWVWRRFGIGMCIISAVLISIILFIVCGYLDSKYKLGLAFFNDGVNPYIILFVLGMVAAEISLGTNKAISFLKTKIPWGLLTLILIFVVAVAIRKSSKSRFIYLFEFIDVLFGVLVMCFLVMVNGTKYEWLRRMLSFKPLVFIGTFAYSIYLMHAPLIQLIWQYLINPLKLSALAEYYLMALFGTPLILFVCYLFFLYFERPFHIKKSVLPKAEPVSSTYSV